MALKPTIHKFTIALSDLDRPRYETLELTVARHPSETLERMIVRVLAYCLNVDEGLTMGRGLSDADEPALVLAAADGETLCWIEVGEPSAERLRKAARRARAVRVYSFNKKSDAWWSQTGPALGGLGVTVVKLAWPEIERLAELVGRTNVLTVTVSGNCAFVAGALGECELTWRELESQ